MCVFLPVVHEAWNEKWAYLIGTCRYYKHTWYLPTQFTQFARSFEASIELHWFAARKINGTEKRENCASPVLFPWDNFQPIEVQHCSGVFTPVLYRLQHHADSFSPNLDQANFNNLKMTQLKTGSIEMLVMKTNSMRFENINTVKSKKFVIALGCINLVATFSGRQIPRTNRSFPRSTETAKALNSMKLSFGEKLHTSSHSNDPFNLHYHISFHQFSFYLWLPNISSMGVGKNSLNC